MKWDQKISQEIFQAKYMLHQEKTPEELFRNVAKEISKLEKNNEHWEETFYNAMAAGLFIPAGRILANARPDSPMKNYNNCFTIDIDDSMEDIYDSLKEDALISKMGGGVGFDASKLRPKGEVLSGGGESSGVISFLRIFDQSAKTIMTGGHRRSAHIALLDISHPDIEEFITVKQGDKNKELTQFNISVKITDTFIDAVEKDAPWDLKFHGKVFKTLPARSLYDLLAENAFIHNEPGIFNSDKVERYNNGYWAFNMDRVNPCGELVMPSYSLCCLAAINLSKLIKNPFSDNCQFDFATLRDLASLGVRFLDNVLDVTDYPLEKIETFSKKWRRIGLGFTGLGNALAMLKLPYGSKESITMAGEIAKALRDASYDASSSIAVEKGSFPDFDSDKFLQAEFVKGLDKNTIEKIKKQGMRNIQLNTVAPTGTISLSVGQNCSSGIEPSFALQYDRKIRTGIEDETRKERVYDYAWLKYCRINPQVTMENKPEYFVTTVDIEPYRSIDMQAEVQKYIDHSISKTLNLPPGTSFEDYKDLFLYAYQKGLKGFTTFNPQGSMKGILEYNDNTEKQRIVRKVGPQRPDGLPGDLKRISLRGENYIILTGKFEGSLYEIFCIDEPEEGLPIKDELSGYIIKESKSKYSFYDEDKNLRILEDFTRIYDSPDASLARFISMALRHGTPLQFIIDQLNKDSHFLGFERAVARVLKGYIQNGEEVITGEKNCGECSGKLIFNDGCVVCQDCGWSKCT
ncbi:MAG: adenosylcobalamin-dependent ribonucleoside-diphosphate reductase [Spirochaetaceae bacterium]|jgi:ribonucleoside-diphosphate reductase alpha chain|nr:adenosylcobalamin-dependent ribonucleoside-diphosphate reductase [Spirochaetaceae bacterium]